MSIYVSCFGGLGGLSSFIPPATADCVENAAVRYWKDSTDDPGTKEKRPIPGMYQ